MNGPPTDAYLRAWLDGYLAGVERGRQELTAEQNGDWPPEKVLVFGRWYDQATERAKHDAETRRQVRRQFIKRVAS